MPDDTQPSEEGAGYAAEDAALASAGEPSEMPEGALEERPGPTANELDAREERFGPRKPMGPTAGMIPETVPEELTEAEETPAEEKPRSGKRKGAK